MEKMIPYEKLSKKKQKEKNAQRRKSWGNICPVTRKSPNPRAYNRRKARSWSDEFPNRAFLFGQISLVITSCYFALVEEKDVCYNYFYYE